MGITREERMVRSWRELQHCYKRRNELKEMLLFTDDPVYTMLYRGYITRIAELKQALERGCKPKKRRAGR